MTLDAALYEGLFILNGSLASGLHLLKYQSVIPPFIFLYLIDIGGLIANNFSTASS
jgi:hypothetical protein